MAKQISCYTKPDHNYLFPKQPPVPSNQNLYSKRTKRDEREKMWTDLLEVIHADECIRKDQPKTYHPHSKKIMVLQGTLSNQFRACQHNHQPIQHMTYNLSSIFDYKDTIRCGTDYYQQDGISYFGQDLDVVFATCPFVPSDHYAPPLLDSEQKDQLQILTPCSSSQIVMLHFLSFFFKII